MYGIDSLASARAACIAFVADLLDALRDLLGFFPGLTGVPNLAKEYRLGGLVVLNEFKKS